MPVCICSGAPAEGPHPAGLVQPHGQPLVGRHGPGGLRGGGEAARARRGGADGGEVGAAGHLRPLHHLVHGGRDDVLQRVDHTLQPLRQGWTGGGFPTFAFFFFFFEPRPYFKTGTHKHRHGSRERIKYMLKKNLLWKKKQYYISM